MHYVYLTDNTVTDQSQVDPHTIFSSGYADGFIQAPDEVTFGWTYNNGNWSPPYVPPIDWKEVNKELAMSLLQSTDWSEAPSVSDPANTPYLLNASEFVAYRVSVRAIAVDPPNVEWNPPEKPIEAWS